MYFIKKTRYFNQYYTNIHNETINKTGMYVLKNKKKYREIHL